MRAQATRVASVPSRADRAGALIDHYHAEHAAIAAGLPGSSAPWVALAWRDALASFTELGFPNAREEAWKYTPVTPIEKRRFQPAGRMCVGFDEDATEVAVGANASVEHYKLQEESVKAFHVATLQVHQGRDRRFTSHSVSFGAQLARNDINAILDAEGTECTLNGLYMADGRQHVDFHTRVDHTRPRFLYD